MTRTNREMVQIFFFLPFFQLLQFNIVSFIFVRQYLACMFRDDREISFTKFQNGELPEKQTLGLGWVFQQQKEGFWNLQPMAENPIQISECESTVRCTKQQRVPLL